MKKPTIKSLATDVEALLKQVDKLTLLEGQRSQRERTERARAECRLKAQLRKQALEKASQTAYWTTATGERILITEMSTSHIANALAMCTRAYENTGSEIKRKWAQRFTNVLQERLS